MYRTAVIGAALVAMLGVTGCDHMNRTEQRALSGGAIGAAGGAAVGAITGGNPAVGAAIGGIGGAAIGAATTPHHDRGYYDDYGYYHRY